MPENEIHAPLFLIDFSCMFVLLKTQTAELKLAALAALLVFELLTLPSACRRKKKIKLLLSF